MTQAEQIEISLSKTKMLGTLFGALAFIGLGVFLMVFSLTQSPPIFSALFFIIGLISVLFFGFCAVVAGWKFFDKNPGLVINRQGITFQGGTFVPWSVIEEIRDFELASQKFLVPIVTNPQEVIDRTTNPLTRKMAEMSFRMCGSPFSVVTNPLKIKLGDLRNLLVEKMDEYKDEYKHE